MHNSYLRKDGIMKDKKLIKWGLAIAVFVLGIVMSILGTATNEIFVIGLGVILEVVGAGLILLILI